MERGEGLGVVENGLSGEGEVEKGHCPQLPNRYWNRGSQFDLLLPDPLPLPLPLPLLLLLMLLLCLFSMPPEDPLCWGWCFASAMLCVIKSRVKRIVITMFGFISSSCFSSLHISLLRMKTYKKQSIYI